MFSVNIFITVENERMDTRGKVIVALCSGDYGEFTADGGLAFSLSCTLTLVKLILFLDSISSSPNEWIVLDGFQRLSRF